MGAKTVLTERCDATIRGIEETRRRISDKAGRLQDRLTPKAMLRPVTKRLRGTLGEGGEKILDTFRDNPLPLTMTALGVAWLFFKDLRSESRGGGNGAAKLQEKAGEAAEGAKEAVRKARSAVKQGFEKGSDWLSTTLQENPLALALGVLALGAIAGLSIPAGPEEEETAGDMGSEVLQKAEPSPGENPRMDIPASEEAPD
ncbi:MAG: hypothetical protein EHM91_07190 [Planctomycetota bacterium]|nr:MAG: hypothetical protein EHM91_07190 [Planctomycetota bacterium]